MAAVDYTFANPSAGQVIFESSKNGGYKEVFDKTLNQTALLLSSRDCDLGINVDSRRIWSRLEPSILGCSVSGPSIVYL